MTTPTHVGDPAATDNAPAEASAYLRVAGVVAAVLTGFAAIVSTLWAALNNDVTYSLGGISNAGEGGVSVWDVFVARPIAYRLLIAWLDLPVSESTPLTVAHATVRVGAYVIVAGVAVALYFGLKRFADTRLAAAVAAATGLALIVSPQWHFLQPDWAAMLAAVLAVGAACAPRRVWLGAVLGGLAACLAIAVKLATAPLALLALVMIGIFSRRRAAWTALSTVAFALLWYATTRYFLPWEWIWLRDQADLVVDAPVHHGLRWRDIHHLLVALGDVMVLSPMVAVGPAAAVALIRRLEPGRPRWRGAAVAVVAAGMSLASVYGQGEFFMYHFAAVPVFATAVWAAAFSLSRAARLPLVVSTALLTAASFVLLRRPPQWRLDNVTTVTVVYALAALAAAVATWALACRTGRSVPPAVGAITVTAALVLATLPHTPLAFSRYNYDRPTDRASDAGYPTLRQRIGPDTPVLYLTFGSFNYLLGNPTTCRYPSPQWLQRATYVPPVRTFPSYADNLRCLTDPGQRAEYLVMQPRWFSYARSSPEVRSLLDKRFDCTPPARIPAPEDLLVCPARR